MQNKRWWIIGASDGLGEALARAMAAEGAELILSARSLDRLEALAATLPQAEALALDVTDKENVEQAIQMAGQIDGILYCAGAYWPMSALQWDGEKAVQMAEVNYLGALRILGHVVPQMIGHKSGQIVFIGSLAGHLGLPNAIGYGSSKAALMHLAENMQADLRGTGVQVQVINPGFIRTRLTDKNAFSMPQIMEPEDAASRVIKAIKSGRFATNFPKPFAWLFTLGRFLPRWLIFR